MLAGFGDLAEIESSWSLAQVLDLNDLLDAKEDAEHKHYIEEKRRAERKIKR